MSIAKRQETVDRSLILRIYVRKIPGDHKNYPRGSLTKHQGGVHSKEKGRKGPFSRLLFEFLLSETLTAYALIQNFVFFSERHRRARLHLALLAKDRADVVGVVDLDRDAPRTHVPLPLLAVIIANNPVFLEHHRVAEFMPHRLVNEFVGVLVEEHRIQ